MENLLKAGLNHKMYSLIVILILNIIPSFTSNLGDTAWHIYLFTLLIIIIIQALYIYRQTIKKTYVHLLAFVVLVISIWDVVDYAASVIMGSR